MKRFAIVVLIILLFIAVAVGGFWLVKNLGRSTVLTNPNAPPCWHEICPGETLSWEAVEILMAIREAGGIRQWDDVHDGERNSIGWLFTYPVNDAGGYIYCRSERVEVILIQTWNALNLGEALETFGEPESQWIRLTTPGGRRILEVMLVYPDQGVLVQVDIELGAEGEWTELRERSRVAKVFYIDPDEFNYWLSSKRLFRETLETIEERMTPWEGLGTVDYGYLLEE